MNSLSKTIIALSVLISLGTIAISPALAQPGFGGDEEVLRQARISIGIVENCDDVRNQSSGGTESTDNIEVYLSEGISAAPAGVDLSCSEIVNCFREKYREEKLENIDARIASDMRQDIFKHCIVSGEDGLGLLESYASLVYRWLAGIVGSICVLVIIISGIQISIGGMSQESVGEAKDRVVRALVGLVVIFLSAFILYTINPVFFA